MLDGDETSEDGLELPEDGLTFDPPMRMHHLSGGLSVLMSVNRLAAIMSPGSEGLVFFSVVKNASLASCFRDYRGLRILGRNHFAVADEMHDPVTSHFAISASSADNRCLAHVQIHQWQGLATALHHLKRDTDALLTTRVASQMRLCLSRVERLSLAYRTVLSIVSAGARTASHKLTGDKYAQYLGSEYRSVLNELYSLRDAILAAAYRLHLNRTDAFNIKKLRQAVTGATGGSSKMISDSMFAADGDLLIRNMSLHRAVAQHCLGATNPVVGDVYQLKVSRGPYGDLPHLVYPLYDDIERMREIEEGSSKGVLDRLPLEEAKRFIGLDEYEDALEFCYDCFEKLLRIAETLDQEIGIEPKMVTITDDDILEVTFTDEAGKVIRAKRDDVTGRLKKY